MSHHQDSTKCAGKCAGLVSLKTSSNKKYTKVKDRRGQPIRGLWKRCGTYYARVTVEDCLEHEENRFALVCNNCVVVVMIGELIGSSFQLPFDDHSHDGTKLQARH